MLNPVLPAPRTRRIQTARNAVDVILNARSAADLRLYAWEMTRELGDGRKRWKGTEEHKGQYRTQKIKPGTRVKSSGDNRRSIGEHIDTLLESPESFTPEHRDDLRSKLLTLTRDQFAALRSQFGIRKQGRRKEDEINTLLEGVEERKGPDPRAGRNREGLGVAKVPEKRKVSLTPQPGTSPAGGQGEKKMATELETPPVPEHKDTLEITASDHGYRLNRKPYVARISAVYSDGNMERDFVKGADGDRPRYKKGKQQKYWDTVYEIPGMGIYETQDGDGSREIIAVIPSVTRPGQWANVTIKKDELLRVNKMLEDHKDALDGLDRIGAATLDDVLRHYSALALQNKQQGGTGSYDDIASFEEAARQLVELAKVQE